MIFDIDHFVLDHNYFKCRHIGAICCGVA